MADYTKVYAVIWNDPDFRACSTDAQWLYFAMLTHPKLDNCGVLPWSSRGLASRSAGMTPERVNAAAWELGQRRLIAIDPDTDEALVRSFVRHDGILRVPNQTKKMVREYGGIDSLKIMHLVSIEVRRGVKEDSSEASAEAAKSVSKQFPEPLPEGFEMVPEWFRNPLANGNAYPNANGNAKGNAEGSATPLSLTPTLTPNPEDKSSDSSSPHEIKSMDDDESPKRKETRLPKSWAPTASHIKRASEAGLNLTECVEAFRGHAETHDRHAANWNAAFTTWLIKASNRKTDAAPSERTGFENYLRADLDPSSPEWIAKYEPWRAEQ